MTFCDERDGGCGASLTATDYEAGFCTQCKRRLSAKESETMTSNCDGCDEPQGEIKTRVAYGCEGDFCHQCRHGSECDCEE